MKKSIFTLFLMFFSIQISMKAQLPSIMLKNINGQSVKTDTLSNGNKPFIVSFFATWCKPCNRELSAIADVYEDWQEETGVKIYAVSIDKAQNINKVRPLADQNGWDYDILLDPNSDFCRALGIQMIPFVLICDGDGKIVYKHNGYTDGSENELLDKVRQLVQKEG
ncbi:MAG: TlpA family protein disulfide reductase [Bacteroidaceae bacterium]|nr:TlpA family protein disulfide reductase [Bacteroidaceae bacterium]